MKSTRLDLRLTAAELERYRAEAERRELTLSAWIRLALTAECRRNYRMRHPIQHDRNT